MPISENELRLDSNGIVARSSSARCGRKHAEGSLHWPVNAASIDVFDH